MVFNYDNWLVWGTLLLFVLLTVFTASHGYGAAQGILAFFDPIDGTRRFLTYALATLIPLAFFNYVRGSLFVFIAFFILAANHIATS